MGEERDAHWYDGAWLKKRKKKDVIIGSYQCPLWYDAVRWIKQQVVPVVDLGCGDGRLARLLSWDRGFKTTYKGVDFSPEAIRVANSRLLGKRFTFAVADITKVSSWNSPRQARCYVFCEVLEHLQDDISVLKAVPKGQPMWLSVPSFDDASHVRWFGQFSDAYERYGRFFAQSFGHGIGALGGAPEPVLRGSPHWSVIYGVRA